LRFISIAHAVEICRYGACELHNISSIIGGIAAQEAVKIITNQYVSLNNTFVYNGIASIGATYKL
jgi:amyloid beta precursor protein binding protein 1